MRHKIGPSDKRVRPANIPPRFTPPAQLYPSPGLRRHLPRFQSFWDSFMWDSLQLKRDKAWALHTYDMESKSGRERGWKRQRRGGKKRGTERERQAEVERTRERKWERWKTESERQLRERRLKSVSWMSYEMQIAHQVHSFILFITFMIKSCTVVSVPSPDSCVLSVSDICLSAPRLSPNLSHHPSLHQKNGNMGHNTMARSDSLKTRSPFSYWCDTSASRGTIATLCGVVRPAEWQLCELCGILPLGSFRAHRMEKHRQLKSQLWKDINEVVNWSISSLSMQIDILEDKPI